MVNFDDSKPAVRRLIVYFTFPSPYLQHHYTFHHQNLFILPLFPFNNPSNPLLPLVPSGAILSGNDISQVILAIFLGYYGNYGHRPRLLGVGVLFAAASCYLAALPHLLYGPGQDAINLVAAMNAHRDNPLGNSSHGMKSKCVIQFTLVLTRCRTRDHQLP